MTTVVGVFGDAAQALDALEALRGTALHTDSIRLVGQAEQAAELASAQGAGAGVAAGPPQAILGGLLESEFTPAELDDARRHVESGGVYLVADELDQEAANGLAQHLRDSRADNVIVKGQ